MAYKWKPVDEMDESHLRNTIQKISVPWERKVDCLFEYKERYGWDNCFANGSLFKEHDPIKGFMRDSLFFGFGDSYGSDLYKSIRDLCENVSHKLTQDYIDNHVLREWDIIKVTNEYGRILAYGPFKKNEVIRELDDSSCWGDENPEYKYTKIMRMVDWSCGGEDEVSFPLGTDYTVIGLGEDSLQYYNKTLTTKRKEKMTNKNEIMDETVLASKLVLGEKLYENLETLAHDYVLGKLTWWQKLTMSKKQKDMAVLVGIFTLVHAIKSGAFGLFDKKVDHEILDILTLACNHKIQTKLFGGIDTNIVKMILTKPEITQLNG